LLEYANQKVAEKALALEAELRFMVFQPAFDMIVIGQSNMAESSVHLDLCASDGVQVMQRPSGGEAVFLSPKMAVISICWIGARLPKSKDLFAFALDKIMLALSNLGVNGHRHRGISDLAIGEKKILGSAIYRKTAIALFHGVLNLSEQPSRIARYLKHPSREPDYRQSRPHEDFVTSLSKEGYNVSGDEFKQAMIQVMI